MTLIHSTKVTHQELWGKGGITSGILDCAHSASPQQFTSHFGEMPLQSTITIFSALTPQGRDQSHPHILTWGVGCCESQHLPAFFLITPNTDPNTATAHQCHPKRNYKVTQHNGGSTDEKNIHQPALHGDTHPLRAHLHCHDLHETSPL